MAARNLHAPERRLLTGIANDHPGATILRPGQQTFDLIEALHLGLDRIDAGDVALAAANRTITAQAEQIAAQGRAIATLQTSVAALSKP